MFKFKDITDTFLYLRLKRASFSLERHMEAKAPPNEKKNTMN